MDKAVNDRREDVFSNPRWHRCGDYQFGDRPKEIDTPVFPPHSFAGFGCFVQSFLNLFFLFTCKPELLQLLWDLLQLSFYLPLLILSEWRVAGINALYVYNQ